MDYNKVLSERVKGIKPSGIRRFFDMAAEMKGQVISLSIGEPDFTTPNCILDAGVRALQAGETHYTANQGIMKLREEISRFVAKRYDQHYDPKTEIVVTVGGSEAIDLAIRALTNFGDEVIVPEPCFVAYDALIQMAGGKPVPLPLDAENGFKLTPEKLESVISEKTKGLILAFPNNPTGGTMTKEDLAKIVPILEKYPDVAILSDELYAELTYEPETFTSLSTFPGFRERMVIINGFSKAFAMTGWRIGYLMAPEPWASQMNKIHQYGIMSSPTIAQFAAIEALKHGIPDVLEMREAYNERRQYLVKALHDMGLSVYEPMGAFYIFPRIAQFGLSSVEFCERFLAEEKVAIIPGDAFGACGEGFVRISYAASLENIKAAMERLAKFTQRLAAEK